MCARSMLAADMPYSYQGSSHRWKSSQDERLGAPIASIDHSRQRTSAIGQFEHVHDLEQVAERWCTAPCHACVASQAQADAHGLTVDLVYAVLTPW